MLESDHLVIAGMGQCCNQRQRIGLAGYVMHLDLYVVHPRNVGPLFLRCWLGTHAYCT